MPKTKKNIKVRDLKPNKDAKGGRAAAVHTTSAPNPNRAVAIRAMDSRANG